MTSTSESKKWWVLFAMTGSLSMIMIDTTIFAVALRPIQQDLGIAQSLLEWVIIIYILVLASMMALGGHIGDLIGKPRAFVIGCVSFGIASLLCGFAWDGPSLIVFRLLQGMAAVIMQPASSAMVIGSFAPGERGRAMAVYAGLPLLLLTVGPVIGGFITEQASWRFCFWINLPIALVVAGATLIIKPQDVPSPRKRFDWSGVLLLVTGLPALILGIQQGNQWGWDSLPTLGLIIGGLMLLMTFVAVELKAEDPVIQLRLFKDRAFLGDALMLMLTQGAVTGVMIFMGLYLQIVLGFDPAKAGAADAADDSVAPFDSSSRRKSRTMTLVWMETNASESNALLRKYGTLGHDSVYSVPGPAATTVFAAKKNIPRAMPCPSPHARCMFIESTLLTFLYPKCRAIASSAPAIQRVCDVHISRRHAS